MRIAIINEHWTAGATRCARDLVTGLQSRHEVKYFPNGQRLTVPGQLDALHAFQPDVVHLHSYYGDFPYSFLGEVARRYPTVFTPHDPRPIGGTMLKCWDCERNRSCFQCPMVGNLKRYTLWRHSYFWDRYRKRRVHARLPRSTRIVCVSDWMRRRMLRTELAAFTIDRIYNGVDLACFSRDAGAREALGLAPSAPVITFAAHTADERKGGHVLARALTEVVLPAVPELVVLAVGGGLIPNLPAIRPVGFVAPAELRRYYSAADVFVAPSLADNLPYTVLEAMACEVPVAASRVGGIPEQIDEGATGRLFDAGDWRQLGSILVALLRDRPAAAAMGRAGRRRVERDFALPGFARNYESLYAAAAGRAASH